MVLLNYCVVTKYQRKDDIIDWVGKVCFTTDKQLPISFTPKNAAVSFLYPLTEDLVMVIVRFKTAIKLSHH